MKEIPIPYIRVNQATLVSLTLLAIVLQNGWLLFIAYLFVFLPVVFGSRANLAFQITKLFIRRDLSNEPTEAADLQRFNQMIAFIILSLACFMYLWHEHWLTWVFTGMVTVAAGLALFGYCIGCTLYYQLKKLRHRTSK